MLIEYTTKQDFNITIESINAYLMQADWKLIISDERRTIYQKKNKKSFYQVTVPTDTTFSDFNYCVKNTIATIATSEHLSVFEACKKLENFTENLLTELQ